MKGNVAKLSAIGCSGLLSVWMALILLASPSALAVTVIGPDGEIVSRDPALPAWTSDMRTQNGEVEIHFPDGSVATGKFQSGFWHGAVTTAVATTGLKVVGLYEEGVLLSSYSELEADLVLGRFNEAFEKRGESPFLGVQFVERRDAADKTGVYVDRVIYNSPAHIAGLQEGDLVVTYDGQIFGSTLALVTALQAAAFGDSKRFLLLRDGQQIHIDVRPHIVPRDHPLVKQGKAIASAEQLWQAIQQRPVQSWLEAYINEVADARYLDQARQLQTELLAAEPRAFDQAISTATLDGYIEYAKRYDASRKRNEIDAAVVQLQAASSDRFLVYDRYRKACALCGDAFGPDYEVLNIGPADLDIIYLLQLQRQGVKPAKLARMIGENPAVFSYREITADEQELLLALGMKKPVIEIVNMKAQQEAKMRGLIASGNYVAPAQQEMSAGVKPSSPLEGTKTGAALQCVKLVAALKACEQMGSLAGMACKAVVQKKVQCALP